MTGRTPTRPAAPDDLDALVALENRCFDGDRMSRRSYAAALRNPRAVVLVAAERHRVMAAATLFLRSGSRAARLYSIAVDPTARGRGLASAMIRDLEQAARRKGAESLRLEVSVDNKTALALYRKSGYGVIGRIPRYYEDGTDAFRLEKPLHAGSGED